MSVTTRTLSNGVSLGYSTVAKGSVSGATTKVSFVFTATTELFGIDSPGTINVYVDGTKKSLSWTVNATTTYMNRTIITKMTSTVLTVSKPFFTLKLVDSGDRKLYEGTFSFYDIEKAATSATAKGGVMNGSTASTVTFTTSSTDATYKAIFSLGTYSGSATSTTKTVSYKIPKAWCNAVPNSSSESATVQCQVLYGGSVYKTITTTLLVSVPDDVVPTITAVTLADKLDTPVPSSWNVFVQHHSGLRVSAVTCAGAYSSTILSIRLQVGTQGKVVAYDLSNLPQIDTITQSGSLTCTVTVLDSRYRYASKTATVTFLPYAAPSFSTISSERCDVSGNKDNDGTYFLSTSAITYSNCNSKNTITLKMQYKRTDAVSYNSLVTLTPGSNVCGDGNLNTEYSYDVRYVVTDQFSTVEYIDYVSTAVYLMHFLHGGRGVAFGQKATMADYLDCNFKALFRDDVFVTLSDGSQFNLRALMSGAITTLLSNVTANRALVSNADGKIEVSDVTATELGYLDGVTSKIQTQINGKQDAISLTANRALVSNSSGKVAVSAVTATELGYLDGVTSKIQTQLNGKQSTLDDTGWQTLTLTSSFEAYNSGYTPKYRRVGEIVTVVGAVKPTSAIEGSSTAVTIFTLPEGCRPKTNTITVCQGSGPAEWMLNIATGGTATFSRHRTVGSSGYYDTSTSAWLPFHVTFIRA